MQKFTIRQAAEVLEMSADFVRDQMEKKRLAYHKIGGRYYIAEDDLNEYIARSRVAAFGESVHRKSKEVA
jgi:excisionase family DNA binding protein